MVSKRWFMVVLLVSWVMGSLGAARSQRGSRAPRSGRSSGAHVGTSCQWSSLVVVVRTGTRWSPRTWLDHQLLFELITDGGSTGVEDLGAAVGAAQRVSPLHLLLTLLELRDQLGLEDDPGHREHQSRDADGQRSGLQGSPSRVRQPEADHERDPGDDRGDDA